MRLPSLPLWPPPRWDLGAAATPGEGTLEGVHPPLLRLYILEVRGLQHTRFDLSLAQPYLSPPRLLQCLAKPCWSATLLHHHHAVVLLLDEVFPNLSLSPCWIKAWETSPGCTCVELGGAVRSALGSPVIWITTSMTPSTPFSLTLPLSDLQGYVDALSFPSLLVSP